MKPARNRKGQFVKRRTARRRNPTGAGFMEDGVFHPIRAWSGYSPARAGDLGPAHRRYETKALPGLPAPDRKAIARSLAVVRKRERAEERGVRADALLTKRMLGPIRKGTLVTDGLVVGQVLGEGTFNRGKRAVPAWRVRIRSGHERGKESMMFKQDARRWYG